MTAAFQGCTISADAHRPLTLSAACEWAAREGYVIARQATIAAFAKAAHVEVSFQDGGVTVVGAEKELPAGHRALRCPVCCVVLGSALPSVNVVAVEPCSKCKEPK